MPAENSPLQPSFPAGMLLIGTRYPCGMLFRYRLESARKPQRTPSPACLLSVAVKICYASRQPSHQLRKTLRRFALTRKFLPAVVVFKAGDGSSVAVGKEVRRVKYFKITKTW